MKYTLSLLECTRNNMRNLLKIQTAAHAAACNAFYKKNYALEGKYLEIVDKCNELLERLRAIEKRLIELDSEEGENDTS